MKAITFLFIFLNIFIFQSCQKADVETIIPFSLNHNEEEIQNLAKVATNYTTLASASKKGCTLKQGSSYYMAVIDLSQGAQIKLWADPVLTLNGAPNGSTVASTSNPSPKMTRKTVNTWWSSNSTVSRLWLISNGTFFDYSNTSCSALTTSSLSIKGSGTIYSCGSGPSPATLSQKVFYVNWNGTQQVAGVTSFNPNSSYSYSNISTKLNSYTTAIVGFDPYASVGTVNYRTYIGVNGNYVYFLWSNYLLTTTQDMINELTAQGVSSGNMVMLDGSGSTQMNCLNGLYSIPGSRCVPSVLSIIYGQ